jgi:lipopolysaccharide biosynthesis glycosyltransferase
MPSFLVLSKFGRRTTGILANPDYPAILKCEVEMPTIKLYFDDNYIPLFKNMLYSAMLYKEPNTNFDLVIGVEYNRQNSDDPENQIGGLTPKGQDAVLKFCQQIGVLVVFEEVLSSEEIFSDTDFQRNFSTMQHIPYHSIVARLKMALESRQDFYYFDVDLIMQPGWDSIFTIEPQDSGTVLMAARDSHRKNFNKRADLEHPQHWVMSDKSNKDNYFNSGVIKFLYKPWNEHKISEKLISLLNKIKRGELNSEFGDQDVLNHVTKNNCELLDQTFNVLVHMRGGDPINHYYSLEKKYHPKILHYVGGEKPHTIGQSRKDEYIHLIDSNCDNGFLDHTQNYYYTYFFIQNQRKLFEMYAR